MDALEFELEIRAKDIFLEAISKAQGKKRDEFVKAACGSNTRLLCKVEALLQSHAGEGLHSDLLEQDVKSSFTSASFLPWNIQAGDQIGPYKLLKEIGQGGCGVVFMAEQLTPVRRHVALKLIKLGMDTKSFLDRFEVEGQALALMDHTNIAMVLDVGATESGRPYLVMELVRGIKITAYCEQNRLSTRERLDLFTQVCRAIQHAHQKGIIHRDIKPSNILVMTEGNVPVPKVIDFGVAKAMADNLTDKTLNSTEFQALIGTPAYMSPEQAGLTDLDIDTRSDIYSLGVLLYELLVNCRPFDGCNLVKSGLENMRRIILETEPDRPSIRLSAMLAKDQTSTAQRRRTEIRGLIQILRDDLDWIVMKCLEKDRTRRYETANSLAMDVQRYIRNELIIARPPSFGYRLQKAVRRNRLLVMTGTIVALILVCAVVVSVRQANRAMKAERVQSILREEAQAKEKIAAEARANEAREREATVHLLYDSLVREARATRNARRVGYRENVFSLLQQAYALKTPQWNSMDLRREAMLCLGDFVGLSPLTFANVEPSADIRLMVIDPSSRLAAFGLWDKTILLRQLPSGEVVDRLAAEHPVRSICFNAQSDGIISVHVPDGSTLGERIKGSRVVFWSRDADGGWGEEKQVAVPGAFLCLSAAGRQFIAQIDLTSPSLLRFLDTDTMVPAHRVELSEEILRFPEVGLSPDGQFVAVGETRQREPDVGAIQVWNLKTDQFVVRLESKLSRVLSVDFSSDGEYLAGLLDNGGVIYTAHDFQRVGVFRDYFESPSRIATQVNTKVIGIPIIQQNRIRLWNWASGEDVAILEEPEVPRQVAFAPNGNFLLTAGPENARLYRLDLVSEKLSMPGHIGGVSGVAFSPDGLRLASLGKDRTVKMRDALTGGVIWDSDQLPAPGQGLAFSPDGRFLVTTDYETDLVWIWDVLTGERLFELGDGGAGRLWSVRFSPNGRYIATAGTGPERNDGIKVWAVTLPSSDGVGDGFGAKLIKELSGAFWSMDISPDSRKLVFHNRGDREVRGLYVWDFLTDLEPRRLETNMVVTVQSASFTPDSSRLILVDPKRALVIKDVVTGETISSMSTWDPSNTWPATEYSNICLSPDGSKIALASASSLGVDIWDINSGGLLYSLPEKEGTVWWMSWSPDSQRLAVSRGNGDVAVWSLQEIEKVLARLQMNP